MKIIYRSLFLLLMLVSCNTLGTKYGLKIRCSDIFSEDLPVNFDDFRIVFISDLHVNTMLKEKHYQNMIMEINKINPDIILLGGDYIDDFTENPERVYEILNQLEYKQKMFGVLGNHDNWVSKSLISKILTKANVVILENRNIDIVKNNQKIFICGIRDMYTDFPDMEKALNGISESAFTILISHSPEVYKEAAESAKVDILLSGHAHGGQVTFFGLYSPVLPLNDKTYWKGKHKIGEMEFLVSNGIGVSMRSIRLFACPAIEVITLKFPENETE